MHRLEIDHNQRSTVLESAKEVRYLTLDFALWVYVQSSHIHRIEWNIIHQRDGALQWTISRYLSELK